MLGLPEVVTVSFVSIRLKIKLESDYWNNGSNALKGSIKLFYIVAMGPSERFIIIKQKWHSRRLTRCCSCVFLSRRNLKRLTFSFVLSDTKPVDLSESLSFIFHKWKPGEGCGLWRRYNLISSPLMCLTTGIVAQVMCNRVFMRWLESGLMVRVSHEWRMTTWLTQ